MTDSPNPLPIETASAGLACDLDALTPAQRMQQAATFDQIRGLVLSVEELPDGWALKLPTELIILEDHVQCLIPRHIRQLQRNVPTDVRIEHDIQSANLRNQPEEIFDVVVFEIQGNDLT